MEISRNVTKVAEAVRDLAKGLDEADMPNALGDIKNDLNTIKCSLRSIAAAIAPLEARLQTYPQDSEEDDECAGS